MKNREFYRDVIMNWKSKGEDFCNEFIAPFVLKKDNCNGMYCSHCRALVALWMDEEYEEPKEPEVDWSQVAVDTPILVRNCEGNGNDIWRKRYFAKYENGVVYAWFSGATSWSADTTSWWKEAKLANPEEA